jgi:transposase
MVKLQLEDLLAAIDVVDQLYLPMNLELDIPSNHVSRVVNAAVSRLDDAMFEAAYPGGGRDSYHPKNDDKNRDLRVDATNLSSRQIAKVVRENVPFMWLAGRQTPDLTAKSINNY